jgi:hypothetical protein
MRETKLLSTKLPSLPLSSSDPRVWGDWKSPPPPVTSKREAYHLITALHLLSWLRQPGTLPPLPHASSWLLRAATTLIFTKSSYVIEF